ncbi:MAG TPA: hypothetical protein VK011_06540 [Acidimicrobiia bacterium]|nr:hypothetical protein [Acidimicrobiia bacterium]
MTEAERSTPSRTPVILMNDSSRPVPLRVRRLLVLAVSSLLLASCTMRAVVDVDVNADGSGTLEMSIAYDEELRQLIEQESAEPVDWSDPASYMDGDSPATFLEDFPEGADIAPYSDGDFLGFTVSTRFDSLEELNSLLEESQSDDGEAFPFRVTTDGSGRFELVSDGPFFEGAALTEEEAEMMPPQMLADLFDIQLRVSLPGAIESTNADETVDGVMVWRVDPMSSEPVIPAAVAQASSSSPVVWLVAVAALVAVAGGVWFVRRRSNEAAVDAVTTPDVARDAT